MNKPNRNVMESNEGRHHQTEEEAQGKGVLLDIKTEDVDASGVDDDSTGLGDDDYLGRSNKEE
jgi:hypothetical protein